MQCKVRSRITLPVLRSTILEEEEVVEDTEVVVEVKEDLAKVEER